MKLAAIDLDGTLLGPNGQISDANRHALQRLQNAGVTVVLASGRHHLNMQRFGAALPGVQWLVSCQGGELSDVPRTTTLHREFLAPDRAAQIVELGRASGFATLVYSVETINTDSSWNTRLDFYAQLSGYSPRQLPATQLLEQPVFKVLWLGEPPSLDHAREALQGKALPVQTVRTHARILEFMPLEVSKASALKILAGHLHIKPSEVIAFGDGENDVPMFQWAGASVAMPHAWPAALRSATYTAAAGPEDSALARAVELIFEKHLC